MSAFSDDAALDELRTHGDRVLDPLVADLAQTPRAAGEMLRALFQSDALPMEDPRFRSLLDALPPVPAPDLRLLEAGQGLFHLYGPEVLLVLGCYALPAAYAAANGAQVIYRSRRLRDDAKRRLIETAQMVLNVMHPDGLTESGIGTRSARKVRLMHALVRRHVLTAAHADPWPAAFGYPINQEDLAGTLLTFSLVVLDGLRKIGVELSGEEERGYLELWRHVGVILGIDESLASVRVEDAHELALRIGRRQVKPSVEGRELARQLAAAVDSLFLLPGYGTSLMHFFLGDTPFGIDLAETLQLPPPNWTMALVRARAAEKRFFLQWLNRVPGARRRRRFVARAFAQRLILLQRPDKEIPFEVPPDWQRRWGVRAR